MYKNEYISMNTPMYVDKENTPHVLTYHHLSHHTCTSWRGGEGMELVIGHGVG